MEKEKDIFGREPKRGRDWSHRRAEPRALALQWTLFLMLSTMVMFASLGAAWMVEPENYRPVSRVLIVTIVFGICVLWPMLRLSQHAPERPVRSTLLDLAALLAPAQALVWPHALSLLSGWPVPVVAALAGSMAAWGLASAGALSIVLVWVRRGGGETARLWGTLGVLAMVTVLPFVSVFAGIGGDMALWMLSPFASVFEITRDRPWTGASAAVSGGHWAWIAIVGVLGLMMLAVGGLWSGRGGLARAGRDA